MRMYTEWMPCQIYDDTTLHNTNSTNPSLFYTLLTSAAERVLPYLYTPTIGTVCQQYFHLPLTSYGLWLDGTTMDAHAMLTAMRAHPANAHNVRIVIVTDGERILGLGDLGAGGMGICEGKSLLYTVAAAVPPQQLLPVFLDVGTNNQSLLQDATYKGVRQPRLRGAAYDAVLEHFMQAIHAWRPHVLIQFEDFGNTTAFSLLQRYGPRVCCFNDDIQGTACVTLAVLLAACRIAEVSLAARPVLFLGAGEAGTGIADLISLYLVHEFGMDAATARRQCVFIDSKGLVRKQRRDSLQHHKLPYAHDGLPDVQGLQQVVEALQPCALIGVSTIAGAFDHHVLRAMAQCNTRPIVLPLSNPTVCAECTYEQALQHTNGRVLFASGSPFAAVEYNGCLYTPDQANNAYVFPATGHAAVLVRARCIPDGVFLEVAKTLAAMHAGDGRLLPRFDTVVSVSVQLMAAACAYFVKHGVGTVPDDFEVTVAQWVLRHGGGGGWDAYCRSKVVEGSAEHQSGYARL